ncbi:MAG: hypothetical protein HS104_09690 [Polyangiaceae bacterium]|nr:hypothetical protein [Polyangiaceae bacterium]MCL4754357.1 hypothetical protein [Myxococcales bacterium]
MISKTPREIRLAANLSITEAAALADVAPGTWRVYERDPEAVSLPKRRACDAVTDRLAMRLREAA